MLGALTRGRRRALGAAVLGALAWMGGAGCDRASKPVASAPAAPTSSAAAVVVPPPATVAEPERPAPDTAAGAAAPPPPNPILPDCVDDPAGGEPECVWKRFALAIQAKDAELKLTKDAEGCPDASFARDLDRLARGAPGLLRKSSWISLMGAHCAAELDHCELVGTLVWRGSVFELRVNHEGVGRAWQGDESTRFVTPGAGGSCAD